jgi:DNA (cytosine-5)-methyltransferase 1
VSGLVVDRFAGPGGWDEGVRPLGLAPFGIELDEDAAATARAAGHERLVADVSALDPREFGPAWGGIDSPPCPGWSIAGKGGARRDSATVLAALAGVRTLADLEAMLAALRATMEHPETLLALEPLRWALALTPSWLAWEQVKEVQHLWNACAVILRRIGYSVATGVVNAEQYGVPQSRRRAVLVARAPWFAGEHGPARLPAPTHSRYYPHAPERLDEGVKPWQSMGQALRLEGDLNVSTGNRSRVGAGLTKWYERSVSLPGPTLTGNGNRWYLRSNYGTGGDPAARGRRTLDQPAPTITSKAGRNRWMQDTREQGERLTLEQASLLQTFPADYPWQGNATARWQQVGDAVPPLLARAIVAEVAAIEDPLR